jgi:hypothetical protein
MVPDDDDDDERRRDFARRRHLLHKEGQQAKSGEMGIGR